MSRDAAPSTWNEQDVFSVSKTEPDMFLKEAAEHGFLQQQRAELSGPAHPRRKLLQAACGLPRSTTKPGGLRMV